MAVNTIATRKGVNSKNKVVIIIRTYKLVSLLLILLLVYTTPLHGQQPSTQFSKKDNKKFAEARKLHRNKSVNDALKIYSHLLKKYPTIPKLMLWTGLAYKDLGQVTESLSFLERVSELMNETNPVLFSTIGKLWMQEKDYTKAKAYFKKYLNTQDSTANGFDTVRNLYDQTNFIIHQLENPVSISPKSLGNSINTLTSEYLPKFTADQSKIYFTRRIRGQEDIYFAEKDSNGYTIAQPFTAVNTERFNEGAHTISSDGRTFIFTKEDRKYGVGGHDLYMIKKNDEGWTMPINLGKRVNSVNWDAQPSLSGNGNILFFASTRAGGYGGKDIWYCVKNSDGHWTRARNAGPIVNTPHDESSPFLHQDMRTLYFRSNGHRGMGSFDIFMSRREVGENWSSIENLGYPINTEGQEGALIVSLDGTKAYFATDHDGTAVTDHLDIFEFDLPVDLRPHPCTYTKLRVIDKSTRTPIPFSIEIIDYETNKKILDKNSKIAEEVILTLSIKDKILINVASSGYLFFSDFIEIDSSSTAFSPYVKTIELEKITPSKLSEKPFVLKNILFESGTTDLLPISNVEIKRLARILENEVEVNLKIIGHTDNIGGEIENMNLSKGRANAVKSELVALGIAPQRIIVIGKGESEPIADNSTPEGRILNRRTEFVLYHL